MHQALVRQLANARIGTPRNQDPRRSSRWWSQAMAPEGDGPCPAGHDPRSAVEGRRRGLRPAPTQVHPGHAAPDAAARHSLGALRQACRRSADGDSGAWPRSSRKPRPSSRLLGALPRVTLHPGRARREERCGRARQRNLDDTKTIIAPVLSIRDVLKYERLLVTEEALAVIAGSLGAAGRRSAHQASGSWSGRRPGMQPPEEDA